jgi:hypothetical protein
MYKKYTYEISSGTDALILAMNQLNTKKVIIPTYTCTDILRAVQTYGCEYLIVDCNLELQIDTDEVIKYAKDYDTVIIPHMFGIRADVKKIKKNTNLKIIEDLSQCHGLSNLGKYADIVVSSTNKSKWIDKNGGGLIFSDMPIQNLLSYDFSVHIETINKNLIRRTELANEIKESGLKLIGSESSWLRAMYYTKKISTRMPYVPLHILDNTLGNFKINQYINNINWISIIV